MQLSNLFEQVISLLRRELDVADVIASWSMFLWVVVSDLRLHRIGSEKEHRSRKNRAAYKHTIILSNSNTDANITLRQGWTGEFKRPGKKTKSGPNFMTFIFFVHFFMEDPEGQ